MKYTHLLSLISRIREKVNRFIVDELKKHNIEGLAPSHGDILVQLFSNQNLCMKDLAEKIDRKKNTVTVLINKLIEHGYVTKTTDSNDSRVSYISLTPKGRGLKKHFDQISRDLLETAYKNIPDSEKNIVVAILEKINNNF